MSHYDLDRMLKDPAKAFERPSDVSASSVMSHEDKISVLRRWREDAIALQRAESEAMAGGEDDFLQSVDLELNRLEETHGENGEK